MRRAYFRRAKLPQFPKHLASGQLKSWPRASMLHIQVREPITHTDHLRFKLTTRVAQGVSGLEEKCSSQRLNLNLRGASV